VAAREAAARLARSARLPNVSLNSSYGRVAYASFPSFSDYRTNWTVGVLAQMPILTGGRLRGDQVVAAADLAEARSRLDLARNLAVLDTRSAFEELDSARATWEASAGTVEQAAQAYDIAQLRYREGISTQLELSDSRFLLEQAQANRAQAARDLQVARARVALLPDLPLGTAAVFAAQPSGGTAQSAAASGAGGSQGRGVAGQSSAVQSVPGGIRQ
jgi:outer membrane protein TolC